MPNPDNTNTTKNGLGAGLLDNSRDAFLKLLEKNPIVTQSGSRYTDDIWDFFSETNRRLSRSDSTIAFLMEPSKNKSGLTIWLPDGKKLSDYPELYNSIKILFAAMVLLPRSRQGTSYSVASLKSVWSGVRTLTGKMVAGGIYRLNDLDERSWMRIGGDKSKFYVGRALYSAHIYRDLIGLENSFLSGTDAFHSLRKFKKRSKQTPWIPDAIFTQIVNMCSAWLARSEYIINLHEKAVEIAISAGSPVYKLSHIFSNTPICADGYEIRNSQELTTATARLQAAAVVMIHAISGMRITEVASLTTESLSEELHDGVKYYLLESIHSKFSINNKGTEEYWLCGAYGAKAHGVLVRLSAHYRTQTTSDYVICPTRRFSKSTLLAQKDRAKYGRDFVKSLFSYQDFKTLPRMLVMAGIVDENGLPIRIHAHQFRRTFARWAARYDSDTSLLALKDHFKHASLLMTSYYAYVDDELLLWFEEARSDAGIESFDKILMSEAMGGVGGLAIKRELNRAVDRGDLPVNFRGAAFRQSRRKLIEKWIASGIYPRYCSGHYCVPRDPNFDCAAQGGGFGCNVGSCANAVYLPEHAPLLKMEIAEEVQLAGFLKQCKYDATPYAETLNKSIRAKSAHLAEIATPSDEAQAQGT